MPPPHPGVRAGTARGLRICPRRKLVRPGPSVPARSSEGNCFYFQYTDEEVGARKEFEDTEAAPGVGGCLGSPPSQGLCRQVDLVLGCFITSRHFSWGCSSKKRELCKSLVFRLSSGEPLWLPPDPPSLINQSNPTSVVSIRLLCKSQSAGRRLETH